MLSEVLRVPMRTVREATLARNRRVHGTRAERGVGGSVVSMRHFLGRLGVLKLKLLV